MNKILSTVGKAVAAALFGYEVGQISQESRIVRVESPPPQVQSVTPSENSPSSNEMLYLIGLILFIIMVILIMRFLRYKPDERPRTIQLQPMRNSNESNL